MRILVTGTNGFIGHNMLEWLSLEESWTIEEWNWDPDNLPNIQNYNWVIHLGAIADMSCTNVEDILIKNLDFSKWLYKQCNIYNVNLQYASSSSVYGDTTDFSENANCSPQTPYAWSKYLFDRWVLQQSGSICIQGFRYFNVYGKWMHLRGHRANAIYKWQEQARLTHKVTVWDTAADVYRDWTWVGDVCRLHIDFIKSVNISGIWNVGSGVSHSFLDIATVIAKHTNSELCIETVPTAELIRMRHKTCANLTQLTTTIGHREWHDVNEWIIN